MKWRFEVGLILVLLGFLAGQVAALTVSGTYIDWHIFNGDSVNSIYTIADEPANFSDVTLFCGLDAYDANSNTTPCYYQGSIVNATIVFNSTTGYPKLITGKIGNAFEFDGNPHELVQIVNFNYSTTDFAFAFWVKINQQSPQGWYQVAGTANVRRVLLYNSGSGMKVQLQVWDTSNTLHNVYSNTVLEPGRWYYVVAGVESGEAYIYINGELDASATIPTPLIPSVLKIVNIGAYDTLGTYQLDGTLDEVRYYSTMPSADEIKLLYLAGRKKLSEPANLTVVNTAYDSTAKEFTVTVNASLPAGAQYLYVPAIAEANATIVQNWSNGDKLIDVSEKNSILLTIKAPVGSALEGIKSLGIETDEGLYAYGAGSLHLTNPLTTPLARPEGKITNTIQDGKVVAVTWNDVTSFTKLVPSNYIASTSGSANLTILQDSDRLMELNLSAPLKLYFQNLLPIMTYDVSDGQEKIASFETDTLGTASYTAPAGIMYIGTPENINDVMSNNLINLLTKILIITIFAGIFVEMTKTKMDDEMVIAVIGLLVVLVIIALIHYL